MRGSKSLLPTSIATFAASLLYSLLLQVACGSSGLRQTVSFGLTFTGPTTPARKNLLAAGNFTTFSSQA
ncbi:hypothetical protein BU16DRAFT_27069 [Lophium mytilinum]|uniref:Secreted protein n=1 Tax=Lophium mytilinum TaxID=390894 RepID=A0A6A6RF50_9PEZI|nr:hypothetical protein BU16DRAFT_27069 [Lophium mytilinum]